MRARTGVISSRIYLTLASRLPHLCLTFTSPLPHLCLTCTSMLPLLYLTLTSRLPAARCGSSWDGDPLSALPCEILCPSCLEL
jgi:hypothetical protein